MCAGGPRLLFMRPHIAAVQGVFAELLYRFHISYTGASRVILKLEPLLCMTEFLDTCYDVHVGTTP